MTERNLAKFPQIIVVTLKQSMIDHASDSETIPVNVYQKPLSSTIYSQALFRESTRSSAVVTGHPGSWL